MLHNDVLQQVLHDDVLQQVLQRRSLGLHIAELQLAEDPPDNRIDKTRGSNCQNTVRRLRHTRDRGLGSTRYKRRNGPVS